MADEPARIAHIIGKLNAAGVEAVMNNYYRSIDRSVYQFDYFIEADGACEPPEELKALGARYFVLPPYRHIFRYIKVLKRYLRENRYPIVHSGMNALSVFPLYAAWAAGVPVRINHNHSTAGKGEAKRNAVKYLLRPFAKLFATHYAACSRYAGEWLFGKRASAKGKVTIFNNAIDAARFRFDPAVRSEVRRELGIEDKFVLGHVGRFCCQKNHEFLLEVFRELHEREPDSVLLLVGTGELRGRTEARASELGLAGAVIFMGVRNDVHRLYQAMDAFALPSLYEGLPLVGVEAQAAGLPCVISDRMTKDTVIIGSTKIVPLAEGPGKWAERILEMRTTERRDTSAAIKSAGFDITDEVKKLEAYYASALSDMKKSGR
ncbi:MAG: glycosyltransferase family 1 protein [Ruminiclostridium sp.]|nr:glycosyltransferase family 1 protein [Ruminiclostridium sp.]